MPSQTAQEILIEARDLTVALGNGMQRADILKSLNFAVRAGASVGLVGESGSGKSTLAKTLIGINRVTSGSVRIGGQTIDHEHRARPNRGELTIQMIPQDPYSSLDPRRTVGQALAEALDPVRSDAAKHRGLILEWLDRVGLDAESFDKYPHEFSGGQRQRVAIARSLCTRPAIVIADEITSALDVSVQAEILQLLHALKDELRFTMLFISHNLAVVQNVCSDVLVMLHGEIVEAGSAEQVFTDPQSDYTKRLLDSVPGSPGFSIRG